MKRRVDVAIDMCCSKFASYAEERLLLPGAVVALVDCVYPPPAEMWLFVTEDVAEDIVCEIFARKLGLLGRLVSWRQRTSGQQRYTPEDR